MNYYSRSATAELHRQICLTYIEKNKFEASYLFEKNFSFG